MYVNDFLIERDRISDDIINLFNRSTKIMFFDKTASEIPKIKYRFQK